MKDLELEAARLVARTRLWAMLVYYAFATAIAVTTGVGVFVYGASGWWFAAAFLFVAVMSPGGKGP